MHSAQVEEIPVVQAREINFRAVNELRVALDVVSPREILVALRENIPAQLPTWIEVELTLRSHHAAKAVRVAVRTGVDCVVVELARVRLIDAGHLQAVLAIVEALAPLGLAKKALFGKTSAGHGQVVSRR